MKRIAKLHKESKRKIKENKKLCLFLVVLFVVTSSISYQITKNKLQLQENENKIEAHELIKRMLEKNRQESLTLKQKEDFIYTKGN